MNNKSFRAIGYFAIGLYLLGTSTGIGIGSLTTAREYASRPVQIKEVEGKKYVIIGDKTNARIYFEGENGKCENLEDINNNDKTGLIKKILSESGSEIKVEREEGK